MTLLRALFNRSGKFEPPADGWFHWVPVGEYPHDESGYVQVVDDAAIRSMANRFTPSILVDFDHFSYNPDKSSEAAAWGDEVQVRADGLWGKMRLTDVGEPALTNGRFRFISPVWLPEDVEHLGNGRIRPLRLDSLGLTNNPNMRGMAPLTNRKLSPEEGTPRDARPQPGGQPKDNETMKAIATRLGLSADAAETAIVAELDKLFNRATGAETKLTDITTKHDALVIVNRAQSDELIDAELDGAGVSEEGKRGKLKPILAAMQNRKERTDFLTEFAPKTTTVAKTVITPLTNRAKAKTPVDEPGGDDTEKAAANKRAARISNRAAQLRCANAALTVQESYARAQQEEETTEAAK